MKQLCRYNGLKTCIRLVLEKGRNTKNPTFVWYQFVCKTSETYFEDLEEIMNVCFGKMKVWYCYDVGLEAKVNVAWLLWPLRVRSSEVSQTLHTLYFFLSTKSKSESSK